MKKITRKRALAEGVGLLALLLLVIYLFSAAYNSVIAGAAPRESLPTPTPRPPSLVGAQVSPDPFPPTDTMTDTIQSVLETYKQRSLLSVEPLSVPSQATLL
ncbi:MAG TPA: hypothetical protein VFX76_03995, partial [Roseiflexaceae bacterium]|nr:hypothetical protein [Roseiflexaceae bacterium]